MTCFSKLSESLYVIPVHGMFLSWSFVHSFEPSVSPLPASKLCSPDSVYLQYVVVDTTLGHRRLPDNTDCGVDYNALEFVDDWRIYKESRFLLGPSIGLFKNI